MCEICVEEGRMTPEQLAEANARGTDEATGSGAAFLASVLGSESGQDAYRAVTMAAVREMRGNFQRAAEQFPDDPETQAREFARDLYWELDPKSLAGALAGIYTALHHGWTQGEPIPTATGPCPAHGPHPHGGATCLDCPSCRPPAATGPAAGTGMYP